MGQRVFVPTCDELNIIYQVETINHDEQSTHKWVPPLKEAEEGGTYDDKEQPDGEGQEQGPSNREISLRGQSVGTDAHSHASGHDGRCKHSRLIIERGDATEVKGLADGEDS